MAGGNVRVAGSSSMTQQPKGCSHSGKHAGAWYGFYALSTPLTATTIPKTGNIAIRTGQLDPEY